MSNRWPQIHDPDEGQRGFLPSLRGRYGLPRQDGGTSPILVIIYILAAFVCLFVCAILLLIPIRLLLSWQ